jgi:hypothetical protein
MSDIDVDAMIAAHPGRDLATSTIAKIIIGPAIVELLPLGNLAKNRNRKGFLVLAIV